jgi:mRNA interferase MazF
MVEPKRGEIWRVDFEPVAGSETGKLRPAVVIGDETLGRLPVRIVVPITGLDTRYRQHPWMPELQANTRTGLLKASAADALQIRTVSLERFREKLGTLPAGISDEIASSIALCIRAPQQQL